ncbi:endonuclease G [Chitinivorax tropicus]|uniref:Endonuclease n=1 Tax=Chitinivorax tropicus TaxID=714531 RepID=A0A840MM06_9PROT|nr:DNA/RNA non-specific endonuclease [Chitinivorax tropicus]MBB5017233.1 endonuclease G [Chitinivorax tropicus]
MKSLSLIAISALISSTVWAGTACPEHFVNGDTPKINDRKLMAKTKNLCFEGYATLHSGVSRTPVWVAEHLTTERLEDARQMRRKNSFHAEEQLPEEDRAELRDYKRSGFDRGHMAPSGDMPDAQAQYESFSLANMIPQNPNNNQQLWEGIESSVRQWASDSGEVYVVSGPLFEGRRLQRINNRVLVPTYVFKAVYDPNKGIAGAYVTPNEEGDTYEVLSINELEQRTGIDVFPSLSAKIKERRPNLPKPKQRGGRRFVNDEE